MKKFQARPLAGLLLAGALVALPTMVRADSLENEIELLRSDIKTAKQEIVGKALKVQGEKADAFWPVYRKYQGDLDKIGDKRIALIKDYAANFDNMSDAKAKELVKTSLDLQSQRTSLLKKYYKDFERVLGSTDAAKLVQVEYALQAALDLQLAAELPLIQKPGATP